MPRALARLASVALGASIVAGGAAARAETAPGEAGAGRLILVVRHPGVEVRLDGGPPLDGPVPAGRHRVEVLLDGFEPWEREVEVRAGEATRVRVELTPTPERRRAAERRRSALAAAAWATAAAGVAVLGTALGLYLWNDHRYAEWNGERLALYEGFNLPPAEAPPVSELVGRARANDGLIRSILDVDVASWALLGVGLAALVAAMGLGFGFRGLEQGVEVALAPSPGGLGLALVLR